MESGPLGCAIAARASFPQHILVLMAKNGETTGVELELHIPQDALLRLRSSHVLGKWLVGRPSRRRVVSTYFDTPDLSLFHRQIEVRARRVGARHILSVKHVPGAEHGRHSGKDWEADVAKRAINSRIMDDRALRKKLSANNLASNLRPIFVTDVSRAVWPLKIKNSSVEFAVNVGEIKSKGRRLPICEVGLELKSGDASGIYALARELRKSVPFDLEPLSKIERGYAFAADIASRPHKAAKLRMRRRTTVGEAFSLIGHNGLMHLRANEACVRLRQDSEGIHQIRVAVRRLRSALSMFRGLVAEKDRKDIARRLKWIADGLAEAREWDVFRDELLTPLQAKLSSDPSLKGFTDEVDKLRRLADCEASEVLASARYTENVLRIGQWWDGGDWARTSTGIAAEPAADFALNRIRKLHRRLRKLGDRIAELDDAGLHEVRIRAKKLRYAIGFFSSLFPSKTVRAHAEALAEIQDCLGALNDSVVMRQLLAQAETQAKELDAAVFARASGLIMGWNTARREEGLKRLPSSWRRFANLHPFWK